MRLYTYIFIPILLIIFSGCSNIVNYKVNKTNPKITYEKDIINTLSKKTSIKDFENIDKTSKQFLQRYFQPWNMNKLSIKVDEAKWALNYKNQNIYLQNYKKASALWFEKQEENANFKNYNKNIKKAITIENTNIRALPTNQVMFKNPKEAGEGFPFDYNQNSFIKINTPVLVSHLSKDKAWAFVETSSFSGWIETNSIAYVKEDFINKFKTQNYYIATKDDFAIYENSFFKEYIKLSTLFPYKNNKYFIATKDLNHYAKISKIKIKSNYISKFPIKFNKTNIEKISNELLDEPYGWGGILGKRDCSSFTKDYFAVFGKHLNRNSKAQLKNGKYFDITNLSNKKKKLFLVQNGKPFRTLVYLKGHIMIYVGIKDGEPLVMHNIWGLKLNTLLNKEYRHIIGKATVTTLEPARFLKDFDEKNSILSKVEGIVLL